jgi:protein-S-isoprenylcysteine O-methyltransferase Ste14
LCDKASAQGVDLIDTQPGKEKTMNAAQYSVLASLIFAIAAVLQFARAVTGLPITIGKTSIPIWASWLACLVAIVLAWLGYAVSH